MDFIRAFVPAPYRALILAAVLIGLWLHGYWKGQQSNAAEIAALAAAGAAQNAQYRKAEKEVQSALQTLVDRYRAAAVERDSYWMRLKARTSPVPEIPALAGGPGADPGHGLASDGGSGSGALPGRQDDLPAALIEALATGERMEATLGLCQAELRACAALR